MIPLDIQFLISNPHFLIHKKSVLLIGDTLSSEHLILLKEIRLLEKKVNTNQQESYLKLIARLKRELDKEVNKEVNKEVINSIHLNYSLLNSLFTRIYTTEITEFKGILFNRTVNTKGVHLNGCISTISCSYCGFRKEFEEFEILLFEKGIEVLCTCCLERRDSQKNTRKNSTVGRMRPTLRPDESFTSKMIEKDVDCGLFIVEGKTLEEMKKVVKRFCKGSQNKRKRILVDEKEPTKEWEGYFDYFYKGRLIDILTNKKLISNNKEIDGNKELISNNKEIGNTAINNTTIDKLISNNPFEFSLLKDSLSICDDPKMMTIQQENDTFEMKIKLLTESFSESFSDVNLLDEVLKTSVVTEIEDSFCSSLRDEIEKITKG